MARAFGNWKSVVAIIATLAGIAVPVWVWQADLNSKSLSVTLLSRIPLQPPDKKSLSGMEISIDGVQITNPFRVVLEIKNNGRKPITADDFTTPLEVQLGYATTFARVQISGKSPNDLEPGIVTGKEKFSLKPTLLNPKDTVEITAITSGADPVFSTKTRIIGISEVSLMDSTTDKRNIRKIIQVLISSTLLFIAASIVSFGAFRNGIYLRKRAAFFILIVSVAIGEFALLPITAEMGYSYWVGLGCIVILLLLSSIVGLALNKQEAQYRNKAATYD